MLAFTSSDNKVVLYRKPACERDALLYSEDRKTFHVARQTGYAGGDTNHVITFELPSLGLKGAIDREGDTLQLWGKTYQLVPGFDTSDIPIVELPLRFREDHLVKLPAEQGLLLVAFEMCLHYKTFVYVDGQAITPSQYVRLRGGGIELDYDNHKLRLSSLSHGEPITSGTFDGIPVAILQPRDYEFVYSDDAATVTIAPR